MKPITLSPAQLDAALGLPPEVVAATEIDGEPVLFTRDAVYTTEALAWWEETGRRIHPRQAGKTAAMPPTVTRPRLECTCAGRDGLCPNCAVGT